MAENTCSFAVKCLKHARLYFSDAAYKLNLNRPVQELSGERMADIGKYLSLFAYGAYIILNSDAGIGEQIVGCITHLGGDRQLAIDAHDIGTIARWCGNQLECGHDCPHLKKEMENEGK